MNKTLLVAALLCAAANPVRAQVSVRYVASIPGSCESAAINGEDQSGDCRSGLVNVAYSNGRSMFAFNMGTMMAFAGDHDRQLSDDRYVLYVSNLNVAGLRVPATGTCMVEGKLRNKATITCQATADSKDAPFEAKIVYQAAGEARLLPEP